MPTEPGATASSQARIALSDDDSRRGIHLSRNASKFQPSQPLQRVLGPSTDISPLWSRTWPLRLMFRDLPPTVRLVCISRSSALESGFLRPLATLVTGHKHTNL